MIQILPLGVGLQTSQLMKLQVISSPPLTVLTTPKAFNRLLKESKLDSASSMDVGADDDDGCAPRINAEALIS